MSFQKRLITLLKTVPSFVDDDGELILAAVQDLAWKIDHDLVKLLLSDKEIKEKFFDKIGKNLIFNTNTFIDYISQKNFLGNSYTRFRNDIGLAIGNIYLRERGDVSLIWPYKDCVLEGGQTKEEEKRKEIFFNEVLADDEINRMRDPKVLTNFTRYTTKGKKRVTDFKRDENGVILENLIIKGNNLMVLHCLKQQFRGLVKLIYIDPPYNRGNDEFGYNDSFNHSSWLVFMKNRLEIAKEMLRSDGTIFIQIDEREMAYVKVLADEVFGRDNFLIQINWQRTTQRSVLGQGSTPVVNIVEYLLCYVKDFNRKREALVKTQKLIPSSYKMYNQYNLQMVSEGSRKLTKTIEHNGQEIKIFKHKDFVLKSIPAKERNEEHYIKRFKKVVRKDSQQRESSLEQLIISNIKKDNTLYSVERIPKQGKHRGKLIKSLYMNDNVIYYLKDHAKIVDKKIFRIVDMNNIWLDYEISSAGIADEGGVKLKRGKKPEQLINRIINISGCSKGDIILDYHLGSGTTIAVAHKLGIQYIGIEQLYYGKNDSVIRLQNVIKGDKSGISKEVNWHGGGDFIYCELMKYNEAFMERIQAARAKKDLLKIWREIAEGSFLNWYVNPSMPEEAVNNFMAIGKEPKGFKKQKHLLAELLDKNQLYVNLSEIDDAQFKVSKENKKLNKAFYGEVYSD
ncbi:DNA methyltransferase [Candidatus Zixiibacteriota bacterium]